MDDYIDYLQDAFDQVSAWEIPEEQFFDTVRDRSKDGLSMRTWRRARLHSCTVSSSKGLG